MKTVQKHLMFSDLKKNRRKVIREKSSENSLKVSLTGERETAEANCKKPIFSLSASDLHTLMLNAQPRHVSAMK